MSSLEFHVSGVFEAIRINDCGGVLRNSEVILDLMDSVERRSTLDRLEKCLAQLEILGYNDPKAIALEKDKIFDEIKVLIQTLNDSASMTPA